MIVYCGFFAYVSGGCLGANVALGIYRGVHPLNVGWLTSLLYTTGARCKSFLPPPPSRPRKGSDGVTGLSKSVRSSWFSDFVYFAPFLVGRFLIKNKRALRGWKLGYTNKTECVLLYFLRLPYVYLDKYLVKCLCTQSWDYFDYTFHRHDLNDHSNVTIVIVCCTTTFKNLDTVSTLTCRIPMFRRWIIKARTEKLRYKRVLCGKTNAMKNYRLGWYLY